MSPPVCRLMPIGTPAVYTISEGPLGPTKIGITVTDRSRMKSLQTGNPRPLTPGMILPCKHARNIERRVHELLAPYRLSGEWFDVSPRRAEEAIDQAISIGCDR